MGFWAAKMLRSEEEEREVEDAGREDDYSPCPVPGLGQKICGDGELVSANKH